MSETILFYLFALIGIGSAIVAITRRHPLDAAMSFLLTLASVAGIFWILDARVLSVFQVLIYAGAIMTLLIFVIMLLNLPREKMPENKDAPGWIIGLAILIAVLGLLPPLYTAPTAPPVHTYEDALQPKQGLGLQQKNQAERAVQEENLFGSVRQLSAKIFGGFRVENGVLIETRELGPYLFAFEILSLLLLVAAVGAVLLAKRRV